MPTLGYDGTEGYVIEINGEFVDSDTDWSFAAAKAEQRFQTTGRLVKDEATDYWGRQTWTMVEL